MSTLFEISAELLELEYLMTSLDGEIPEGAEGEALAKYFATVHENRDEKLDNYAALIRQLEARAEVRKAEAARLTKLQKADEKAAERLEARLKQFFEVQKIDKTFHTRRATFQFRAPGKPKVLLTEKGEKQAVDLPEGYRRAKFEADKIAIYAALTGTDEVLKKTLAEFAKLDEPKPSLLIK